MSGILRIAVVSSASFERPVTAHLRRPRARPATSAMHHSGRRRR